MLQIKRVYEPAAKDDGYRVLVDRLWPRGISKEKAQIDLWLREIAPSDILRKWFHHEENDWNEFVKRYKKELDNNGEIVEQLKKIVNEYPIVTLLYGSKNMLHNQAVIILAELSKS